MKEFNHCFAAMDSNIIVKLFIALPSILIALTVHEFFHGWTAWQFGDPTAKYEERLSLNPLKHLDPVGSLFLLVTTVFGPFPFGWARPVPVDPNRLDNPTLSIGLVALAGPLSNLSMAFLAGLLFKLQILSANIGFIGTAVYYFALINIGLALFNLLPVPPLDGWKILRSVLPSDIRNKAESFMQENYAVSTIIFIGVIYFAGPILAIPFTLLVSLLL